MSAEERVYRTPAAEFELRRIALAPHGRFVGEAAYGPDALLVLQGSATITACGQSLRFNHGQIVFVPFGTQFVLETVDSDFVVYQAGLPRNAHGAA